jgi:hypothetical protein
MLNMKRTQIYLDEELDLELRRTAFFEGRSAAALIREAVRAYLDQSGDERQPVQDPFADIIGAFATNPAVDAKEDDAIVYELDRP